MNLISALRHSRVRPPRSLNTRELRAIWELRCSNLELKPGVDPEVDFEGFCQDYQHPGLVWMMWEGDRVVGTYLQRTVCMRHAGRDVLVLAPDYVFLAEHLRGHLMLALAVIWLTVRPMMSHPTRRAYATGGVYPSAYIPWRRRLGVCWSLGDPEITEEQASLVAATGARIWGERWRDDGCIPFRTMPVVRRPSSPDGLSLFDAYERLNPSWRQGVALYFVTPLNLATITGGIRTALMPGRRSRVRSLTPRQRRTS